MRHILDYPADILRLLIFLLALAAVYGTAAAMLFRSVVARLKYPLVASRLDRPWVRRIVLGAAAAGIVCVLYGHYVEPNWLEVTHVAVSSAKLNKAGRSYRIVHISDTHSQSRPRLEEKLPDVIAAQKPDLIVFTGDTINGRRGLPVFKQCLTRLAKIAPTFVVRGNWDAWYWDEMDLFGGTGAVELEARKGWVELPGAPIALMGITVGEEQELPALLAKAPPGDFSVFLYHYPDELALTAKYSLDLYCAGHTHGGQIRLPFYGALMTSSRTGKKYESGLYQLDKTRLYVNRGIGMTGGIAPHVRFLCRPEVTVIDIKPEAAR